MHRRQASVRNVRSKCRCSCVLQFTFRHAVSCVLHRPPSQVIHCIVLSFSSFSFSGTGSLTRDEKMFKKQFFNSPSLGGSQKPESEAKALSAVFRISSCQRSTAPQRSRPPLPSQETLTVPRTSEACSQEQCGLEAHERCTRHRFYSVCVRLPERVCLFC